MVSQSLDVHDLDAFSFVPPNGYWLRQNLIITPINSKNNLHNQ